MTASHASLRPLAVLGCTSSAGKSLTVTALCRWFARQGVDVAPFKAQNMSNNARVVDGGEIGVAQWLQAIAARQEPSMFMNPVLLKPEADTRSQVVVNGQVRHDLTTMPWRDRGPYLWPAMSGALDTLRRKHELVLIEGAGSPAEINLPDLVNNRIVDYADAAALLVVDIDKGGAFAHLFGTWTLVPETTRVRLGGYVLNKFRGDATLLEPGPAMLHEMTGLKLAGVVPMVEHQLPDEEGATIRRAAPDADAVVGIVRYPYSSNLDEFQLLAQGAHVRWIANPREMLDCDVIILPGSKNVAADLNWLRVKELDVALRDRAAKGGRIIGVCGGCMMLGGSITDIHGIEGASQGLGLLALRTEFETDKITRHVGITFPQISGPFAAWSGLAVEGYEIRNGWIIDEGAALNELFWTEGATLATTVHGLFEDPAVVEALVGYRPPPLLEETFEQLADLIDERLDTGLLWSMVGQ
jgi:adenosylcobyric acid synthase